LISIFIDGLKLRIKPLNQLIKRGLLRKPGSIETDISYGGRHHNPPVGGDGGVEGITKGGYRYDLMFILPKNRSTDGKNPDR
jgi:hypothetical protein